MILPATAEATGGICMACKQGIRKSIEASRAFYKRLAEYDPVSELWKSLVTRSTEDRALTSFTSQERTYFAVGLLEGEVYNGGFDQYFSNSAGDYFAHAEAGLVELDASDAVRILREAAKTVFGRTPPPEDQAERWKAMERHQGGRRLFSKREAILNALDKQFWDGSEDLADRLAGYAKAEGLLAPFER